MLIALANQAKFCANSNRELMMGPLRFEPILKRIRWGGRRLGTALNKPLGEFSDYAESWELADHADGQSRVVAGPYLGKTLHELITEFPQEMLGSQSDLTQFPLLVKFLDVRDRLSIQVHPNDAQARAWNPVENGKTECWLILDAQPGSVLYSGLKRGVDEQILRRHLAEGTVEECLYQYDPEPGDCVLIPAGTVHAISEGILLAEIQQMSNLTFRLHDWGRLDSNGLPRETHVDQAMRVIDFARGPVKPHFPELLQDDEEHEICEMGQCEHFRILGHTVTAPFTVQTGDRFQILMTLEGDGHSEWNGQREPLKQGDTLLLPASAGEVRIIPDNRQVLLQIWKP